MDMVGRGELTEETWSVIAPLLPARGHRSGQWRHHRMVNIGIVWNQYAIALLCLYPECPPDWPCQCNAIRYHFNVPPADHELPTDQFELAELEREAERQRPNSEPRFPDRDDNAWTE
jgi:hypothetical protein